MTLRPELLAQLNKYNAERENQKSRRTNILESEPDEENEKPKVHFVEAESVKIEIDDANKIAEKILSETRTIEEEIDECEMSLVSMDGLPSWFLSIRPEHKDKDRIYGIIERAKKSSGKARWIAKDKEEQFAKTMASRIKDRNKCLRRAAAAYEMKLPHIFEQFRRRYNVM